MSSPKNNGKRTFTINNAYHVDGCKTKFAHKDYTGRFSSHSAQRAASKALTQLCHVKKIRGACTLYIEMRETTQGSKHKLYGYHCKRIKYDKPVMKAGIEYHYDSKCTPVRIPTEKCAKSHKSSGRMRSYKHKSSSSLSKSYMKKHTKKSHNKKTHKHSHTKKSMVNKIMNKFM